MKRILQLLWCWLAIALIFLFIQLLLFIKLDWEPIPYGAFAAAIPAILSGLIVLFFVHRSPALQMRREVRLKPAEDWRGHYHQLKLVAK